MHSKIPIGFSEILKTPNSKVYNLYTTLQQNTGGRRHFWPRGEFRPLVSILKLIVEYVARMLGGCESHKYPHYLRLYSIFSRLYYQRTSVRILHE